ncbi:MAG: RNA-binding S4 domain-containing protein [Candidatus Marinimicrobia bacterium]|nr:RNA-binding S4 domain-containing protein [Candidatus Neomarinimicrobiota bacterium]
MNTVRIDKWLWAARFYKTRSAATAACHSGKVKLNGKSIKPSHTVKVGDLVQVTSRDFKREIEISGLHDKRVAAAIATTMYIDRTPPEVMEDLKARRAVDSAFFQRQRGGGRPTKKDRRQLDEFKEAP